MSTKPEVLMPVDVANTFVCSLDERPLRQSILLPLEFACFLKPSGLDGKQEPLVCKSEVDRIMRIIEEHRSQEEAQWDGLRLTFQFNCLLTCDQTAALVNSLTESLREKGYQMEIDIFDGYIFSVLIPMIWGFTAEVKEIK